MDWTRFLEENNIHYVTRGPNTKRGEVSIQCPMCGDEDPSEHCGINLTTGKWGCHRNANHRGKSARTLIKALLGCSSHQAGYIVKQYSKSDPDTLDAMLTALEADNNGVISHDENIHEMALAQSLDPQFKDFYRIKARGITSRFFDYLTDRGYDNAKEVIERYELRCALTGRYKDRIILPIRHNGDLIGWTSRALGKPRNAPRYLASSELVKKFVFNYDELKEGGERLIITEGPFDAIKVDNFNFLEDLEVPYRATCTFGTSVTISQIVMLRSLMTKFKETWILFDEGADEPARELSSWINAPIAHLPVGIGDPGNMTIGSLRHMGGKNFAGWFHISVSDWALKLFGQVT